MGVRSTFVTDDWPNLHWPGWFVDIWRDRVFFNDNLCGVISSKAEGKTYMMYEHLHRDITLAIDWDEFGVLSGFNLIWLHEDGGISRVRLYRTYADIDGAAIT